MPQIIHSFTGICTPPDSLPSIDLQGATRYSGASEQKLRKIAYCYAEILGLAVSKNPGGEVVQC
jgi:hypothetical protein